MSRKVTNIFCVVGLFVIISNRPVESFGIPDALGMYPAIRSIIDTAECYHTGGILMYWDPHVPQHAHGGYPSDFTEAFSNGMWMVPNVKRLEERIRHLSHGCREMLAASVEYLHVVRKVSHPKPTTTTTTTKPPPTTTKTTTTTTTTTTTPRPTHAPTGVGCPTCDPNLNCVWTNHCGATQVCLVRSYPNYPFSTHCAEKLDCKLMKQLATGGEIFCCEDEACVHSILGV